MSYNPINIGRSPYVNNPQCNQIVKTALSNGYVNQDELNNINRLCKTEGGLNIFDKIYNAVKDGRFNSEELTDIIQTDRKSVV